MPFFVLGCFVKLVVSGGQSRFMTTFWNVTAARQHIHTVLVQVEVNEFLEHIVGARVFKVYTEYT